MKHCGFCGDIEIGTADLCQKCGYKLKEIQTLYSSDGRIDYEPLHSQLEKIDTITIGFKKGGLKDISTSVAIRFRLDTLIFGISFTMLIIGGI